MFIFPTNQIHPAGQACSNQFLLHQAFGRTWPSILSPGFPITRAPPSSWQLLIIFWKVLTLACLPLTSWYIRWPNFSSRSFASSMDFPGAWSLIETHLYESFLAWAIQAQQHYCTWARPITPWVTTRPRCLAMWWNNTCIALCTLNLPSGESFYVLLNGVTTPHSILPPTCLHTRSPMGNHRGVFPIIYRAPHLWCYNTSFHSCLLFD